MRARILSLVAFSLALAGCGGPADGLLHGTVTANGKQVEAGYVSLQPLDGRNRTCGAAIDNGKFTAAVAPGKYTLIVTGGGKVPYPQTQEELKMISDEELALVDQVPADAKGNQQVVEVLPGSQELNIVLEYPVARR